MAVMWGKHNVCFVDAGIVQTALYLDFFYNYLNAKRQNIDAPIELPA